MSARCGVGGGVGEVGWIGRYAMVGGGGHYRQDGGGRAVDLVGDQGWPRSQRLADCWPEVVVVVAAAAAAVVVVVVVAVVLGLVAVLVAVAGGRPWVAHPLSPELQHDGVQNEEHSKK